MLFSSFHVLLRLVSDRNSFKFDIPVYSFDLQVQPSFCLAAAEWPLEVVFDDASKK
jgi:hypothetical protein